MITIHNVEQGSPEWLELRAGKYTGSNAHKLLKYGTIPYSLTTNDDFKGNFHTNRGHLLENEAIEIYESIKKCSVKRAGFITNTAYPNCGYSPDGIDGETLLEVKCFNQKKHLAISKGEIPFEILAQVYFGLLICNLKQARLILYHPKVEPKLAIAIREIKNKPAITNNFKRIMKGAV